MELDDYRNLLPMSVEDTKKLTPIFELFKLRKDFNIEIVWEKCKHEPVSKLMTPIELKKLGEDLYKMWIENEN